MASTFFNYFSISELLRTCNNSEVLDCVHNNYLEGLLCLLQVLDNFREFADTPIKINSSFRSKAHNEKVGGVRTSQHLLGQAIDFAPCTMPISTFQVKFREFLRSSSLERFCGQVIFYPTFIHVGLRTPSHSKLQLLKSK